MDQVIHLIESWGYLAVFLRALVEGESIILTASGMASQGHLVLWKIMILAFTATTIADQLLYMVGYRYGESLFQRFPKLNIPAQKAFHLLRKYDTGFIISCRFIYGIRVASAIAIGAAKIPPRRFIPLNILSATIWTIVSCTLGYYLGHVVFYAMQKADHVQKNIFFALVGVLVVCFVFIKIRKNKK